MLLGIIFSGYKSFPENGLYWGHSENLILSALSDEDSRIREKTVNQILRIWNDSAFKEIIKKEENEIKKTKKCTFKKQRVFIKPKINYDAATYTEMINWETQAYYELPFTSDLTDDEICSFKASPLKLDICNNSVQTESRAADSRCGPLR